MYICLNNGKKIRVEEKQKFIRRMIAENALGKKLPPRAIVHDGSNESLVICENQGYHNLLHSRIRAYKETGNAKFKRCSWCKKYDDPSKMKFRDKKANSYIHATCRNEKNKFYGAKRKV